jgi:hypothetical protein
MAFYWTVPTYGYSDPNFVITWSQVQTMCRVHFRKWNADTQAWDNYYGYEEDEGIWDSSSSTVTEDLSGWDSGYYWFTYLVLNHWDGEDQYYFKYTASPGYGYKFKIGVSAEAPDKATDPTPADAATGVDRDITTFTWSV